jgi:hypothetical protein
VVHALTGSADAAGDWWEPLIAKDAPWTRDGTASCARTCWAVATARAGRPHSIRGRAGRTESLSQA